MKKKSGQKEVENILAIKIRPNLKVNLLRDYLDESINVKEESEFKNKVSKSPELPK